ncbi:acidic phospholipase A2-like [Mytilus edulis]|uniref:acidic phospholipase A2-like n=1 Tax=Mytilus edulis TaxID=6550 RepID=UPI0039EF0626
MLPRSGIVLILCMLCLANALNMRLRNRKAHLETSNLLTRSTINREADDYSGYGNYCGVGGRGPVLDPIDACCKEHDDCYLVIDTLLGCNSVDTNFILSFDENAQELNCSQEVVNTCRRRVCVCDVDFARCLQINDVYYDPSQIQPARRKRTFKSFFL